MIYATLAVMCLRFSIAVHFTLFTLAQASTGFIPKKAEAQYFRQHLWIGK